MSINDKQKWTSKIFNWYSELLYKLTNWIFRNSNGYSSEFKKLFFDREIGELYGTNNGNFWKLILLYVTLFVSVGFGIQSKRFFNKQLNNPFVRFLSVPIQGDAALCADSLVNSLKSNYMAEPNKSRFHLDAVRSMSVNNPIRFSSNFIETSFEGMADNYNSPLVLEAVCNSSNGFIGRPFSSVEERSVIVTLNLLKDLYLVDSNVSIENLSEKDIPGYLMFQPSGFGQSFPLLIQGVTEQLPYGSDFLLPGKFNDYLFYDNRLIYHSKDDFQVSFYIDSLLSVEGVKSVIDPIAEKYGVATGNENLTIEPTSSIHSSILVSIRNVPDTALSGVLHQAIVSEFKLKNSQVVDAYYKAYDMTGPDYVYKAPQTSMLFVFNDLKKVSLFNDSLKAYSSRVITSNLMFGATKKLKGIELEMTNIKLRFILNLIELIVLGFIIIIVVLAGTSLMSFVRVLFEKYFQKIEKNIGTFMAFGINIKIVYSIMLTIFVITTVIVSFIIAIVLGYTTEFVILKIVGYSASDNISLFSIFNLWILVVLIVIFFANYFAFRKASRIFSKWPGDIINNR